MRWCSGCGRHGCCTSWATACWPRSSGGSWRPGGHTPLHVLAGPLYRLSGSYRFYNLLEQHGYGSVEEVAATPEACWLELRNCGTRFIAAVRQALAGLRPGDAPGHARPGFDAAAVLRAGRRRRVERG